MHATDFEKLQIKNFSKEILSENKIRFSNQKNLVLHLQVDSTSKIISDSPELLKKEVEEMLQIRKTMYKIFGFKNVQFDSYQKIDFQSLPTLEINGNYQRINNRPVFFKELNVYINKKFLQIKLISENKKIDESIAKDILDQIIIKDLNL